MLYDKGAFIGAQGTHAAECMVRGRVWRKMGDFGATLRRAGISQGSHVASNRN